MRFWVSTAVAFVVGTMHQVAVAQETAATLEARLIKEGVPSLAKAVLADGDAKRGAVLFHRRSTGCNRCHATGTGTSLLGPDLTRKNPKMTAAHVVESILVPSKVIEKEYQAVKVVTNDDRIVNGIIQEDTPKEVKLALPVDTGKVVTFSRKDIADIIPSRVSLMPIGQVNTLADRGEFLDLARYVFEIAKHGPELARKLQPAESDLQFPDDGPIDHADKITKLASFDLKAGKALYTRFCVSCHGEDGNKTINPLARRFAKDPLKFGTDPYAMWKTISYGSGLMFPQAALMTPDERYQVVNYIRETFIREANPTQYFKPSKDYLAAVNARAEADAKEFAPAKIAVAAGMLDGSQGKRMEYGPYLAHSVAFTKPSGANEERFEDTTERALIVRLPGDHVVCYDTERGSVAGIWTGDIANRAHTHHTSYKGNSCLQPGGPVAYKNIDDMGWSVGGLPSGPTPESVYAFRGHHLHGGQVLLHHEIAGVRVDEMPGIQPGNPAMFSRTFRFAPTDEKAELHCLIGRVEGGTVQIDGRAGSVKKGKSGLSAAVTGHTENVEFVADDKGGLWLKVPNTNKPRILTVWSTLGTANGIDTEKIPDATAALDFDALTLGGPRRWPTIVRTKGVLGKPVEGYAADEITVPFANPWGSWMRLTAVDFFADGAAAVATLSGDVWIVRWNDADLTDITWSRFATGLYEPLGLRIVAGKIYVRGRDRITRLHDVNNDGEADFYECFHQHGVIGPGYHAFVFDLQTDRDGNFYFARSGRKSPHEGGVIRISPDGTSQSVVCRDFRHPNGMGAGGPHDWITVSDNPDGKAVYNGVALVREGETYGYEAPRTTPMLAVLPPSADSSSGGQCWADPKRWGPLSGHMIHTSYSRLSMFHIITQDVAAHPNGFAVRLPIAFPSGVMRPRVNPVDGQVYVIGQKGWDTQAKYDGCFYRIRHVPDTPSHVITDAIATRTGIRLTFSCDLDPKSVKKSDVEVVREEDKRTVPVATGEVNLIGKRTVEVVLPQIEKEIVANRTRVDKKTGRATVDVLAPLRVTLKLKGADDAEFERTVYATINSLPKE